MSQSEIKQFEKLVIASKHILILLPENPQGDYFCSALALSHFCDAKNIATTIAFNDPYEQISLFEFLPQPNTTEITHTIAGTRDIIITFNTKYNKILDVKTQQSGNEFKIFVTPEKGMIESRDISFVPGKFPYDTIVTIGATDKESMGKLYEEIPDIFYELPIINIDNKSANEQFGQINIINSIASSTSEIFGEMFEELNNNLLSKNCAQCLLTGIISETHSFQNHKTTPRAMTLASRLIEYGADQQLIIRHLYRNLPFSLLQLWGRAMKVVTTSKYNKKTVISVITQKDIEQTKAKTHHIYSVLEKMKESYPSGQIFILIYENVDKSLTALVDAKRTNATISADIIENLSVLPNEIYKIPLQSTSTKDATEEVCKILLPITSQIK
jgi:nanoRNase/pAp phosphatase (c-di-AMP/oligoRNAs hydrolase)